MTKMNAPAAAAASPSSASAAASAGDDGNAASSAALAAAQGGANPPPPPQQQPRPSEESLVLSYLRKHGLSDAASELQRILQKYKAEAHKAATTATKKDDGKNKRKRDNSEGVGEEGQKEKKLPSIDYDASEDAMDLEDAGGANTTSSPPAASGLGVQDGAGGDGNGNQQQGGEKRQHNNGNNNNTLAAATGGGLGYDLDAAPTIALWGAGSAPPALRSCRVGGNSSMPSTGLQIDDDILSKFHEVKMKSGSLDWITIKQVGEQQLSLDNYFPKTPEDVAEFKADKKNNTREDNFLTRVWGGFVDEMKKAAATRTPEGKKRKPQCRYSVLNSFFESNDRLQDRLLFFAFIPAGAKIRDKMIFSASKESLTARLDGLSKKFNFTSLDEFDWDEILPQIAH